MARLAHPDSFNGGIRPIGLVGARIPTVKPAPKPKPKPKYTPRTGMPLPAPPKSIQRKADKADRNIRSRNAVTKSTTTSNNNTKKKNTRTTTNTRNVNPEPRISTKTPDNTVKVTGVSTDPASVEVPEAPKPLSMEDWLLQDSAYTSEQAALAAARDAALAEYSRNRDLNAQDFTSSLGNLGRRWEDTNNNGIADEEEIAASTWDRDNTQGAYGQSYKNTLEDFTGRGLLDSSFFADALTELDTSFDSQLGDMSKARQNALAELLGRENEAKSAYETGLGQAQATAAERRAAKYGL